MQMQVLLGWLLVLRALFVLTLVAVVAQLNLSHAAFDSAASCSTGGLLRSITHL
jgi:hypothetical protein